MAPSHDCFDVIFAFDRNSSKTIYRKPEGHCRMTAQVFFSVQHQQQLPCNVWRTKYQMITKILRAN